MLYRHLADVSEGEIKAAGKIALEACTPEAIEAFLVQWDPWKKHLRRQQVTPYESLPLSPTPYLPSDQCSITFESPQQPILVDANVYEYAALVTEFIRTGVNPVNRNPIVWGAVSRLAIPTPHELP